MTQEIDHKQKLENLIRKHDLAPADPALYPAYFDFFQRIDHILYTEWDPIGVHTIEEMFDCRDEYHRYLPAIAEMVQTGASIQDVSDQLFELENLFKGDGYEIRRRCDVIAVLVTRHGPHAAELVKSVVVNTNTEELTLQSILDLLTQTHLDAYEGRWDAVCAGYRQIIDICTTFLPAHRNLRGSCLNNLGVAYSHAGQTEEAVKAYLLALPDLAQEVTQDEIEERNYSLQNLSFPLDVCLKNLINNFRARGKHADALAYEEKRLAVLTQRFGEDDEDVCQERERLQSLNEAIPINVELKPRRISIYADGPGLIKNVICID